MNRLYLSCLLTLVVLSGSAQQIPTQRISGKVIDANNNSIAGATVMIVGVQPPVGYTTDDSGYFAIDVPLGRQVLRVSSVGFTEKEVDLLISAGESQFLDIHLEPAVYSLDGIEVVRYYDKTRPLQPLIYAGARSFSVDETERYAGALGDPARMVRSFAGVMPINDSRNEIVVRGNSPMGVQYRVDGIEIPNPNHFNAGIGMTAGQVTILNMNMVTNSDFLMGGWQANKGNALAAIFDINLRKGNPLRHQMRFQMGYNGLELMAEGPVNKSGSLTYLASYRYSIPELTSYAMKLFNKNTPVVPKYNDLSTKLHWQISDQHSLSLITILGNSQIRMHASEILDTDSNVKVEGELSFDQIVDLKSALGLAGLVYEGQLTDRTDMRAALSWNYNRVNLQVDTVALPQTHDFQNLFTDRSTEHKVSFSTDLRHRFSSHKDQLYVGAVIDLYRLSLYNEIAELPFPLNDDQPSLSLLRGYAQYQHLFGDAVTATLGVHAAYLPLNNSYSIEPRAGIQYKIGSHHTLGLSGGLYSQLPPHSFFFVKTENGNYDSDNHRLGFSKSWHINMAYNYQINKDWRIRTELYYQHLFDIPAEDKAFGTSLLNFGSGENYVHRVRGLRNIGKGQNYGLELTVEKFLSHNYFLLISGTLYRSLYTDPVLGREFSSTFDGGYLLNITGGKEWLLNDKWALFVSPQLSYAGGLKYTPVDEAASNAAREIILDTDQWYAMQLPDYFRLDARFGVRFNKQKSSHEFGVDLINITNRKNIAYKYYDIDKGEYSTQTHFTFFPMVTYRLNFGL